MAAALLPREGGWYHRPKAAKLLTNLSKKGSRPIPAMTAYILRRLLAHRADHDRHHARDFRHRAVRAGRTGRAADRAAHRHRCQAPRRGSAAAAAISAGPPGHGGTPGDVSAPSKYRGAQGLDPEFIKSLEKQFGFDKPAYERFVMLMWNYLRFDFGQSYFRDTSVLKLIGERLPVSISLGLWMTLISYAHLDSARHSQGRAGRLALRRVDQHGDRHRLCHSGLPVRRVPDRAVRRRLVLEHLPVARADRRRIGRSSPGQTRSSTISGTWCCR